MKPLLKTLLPPVVVLVVATIVAEMWVRLAHVKEYNAPPPSRVLIATIDAREMLWHATLNTAMAAGAGFGVSMVLGVLVAVVLSASRWVERALYPFTVFLQTVPLVAIAPLLYLWLGAGQRAVIVCAVICSLFPVIANTFVGLRSTDPALLDLFKLYGASRLS